MKLFLNGLPLAQSPLAKADYENDAESPSYIPDGFRHREIGEKIERTDIYWGGTGKYYTLGEAAELGVVRAGAFFCAKI